MYYCITYNSHRGYVVYYSLAKIVTGAKVQISKSDPMNTTLCIRNTEKFYVNLHKRMVVVHNEKNYSGVRATILGGPGLFLTRLFCVVRL